MMQNDNRGHVMDQELHSMRVNIQERIRIWLDRRNISNSPVWQRKLPEIARRVEATIFRDCSTKEEYAKIFDSPIENRLAGIMRRLQQQQLQLLQQLQLQQQVQQQHQVMSRSPHHDIPSNSAATRMTITAPSMMDSNDSTNSTGDARISSQMETISSASVNSFVGAAGDLELEDVTSGGDEDRLLDALVNKE